MESRIKSFAVLIPAYNAEASLSELISRLHKVAGDVQIIVVDDGSVDQTCDVAVSLGVTLLQHKKNRGKGAALQTGFEWVKHLIGIDYIFTVDADLQHQPEDIPKFLALQRQTGADIIIGWRERRGTRMPVHRRLSNTITSSLVGMRTGITIKDSQCGFRMIRRSVLERIQLESAGYEAETELLLKAARAGCSIDFVPVHTVYGNEKSYMTHWTTTRNFIKVLFRDYA
jgi:glycosyltransferase involved in cell wall biosynthesis